MHYAVKIALALAALASDRGGAPVTDEQIAAIADGPHFPRVKQLAREALDARTALAAAQQQLDHRTRQVAGLVGDLAKAEQRIAKLEAALKVEREDHQSILREFGRA